MLNSLKNLIRPLIPKALFRALQPVYHGSAAILSSWYYGHPSSSLKVIGVTGTAGKSTTVMMLAHILNSAGLKTGYVTTVGTSDGSDSRINKQGLSMPAGPFLQKFLNDFSDKGCKFAIIEATSEGLAQNRHWGIDFAGALFTNLSPAHIESHGSFEKYRAAKEKLFAAVNAQGIIGVNTDDPNYQYFLNFGTGKKFGTSTREDRMAHTSVPIIRATDITVSETGLAFAVEENRFHLNLKGSFNISNALLAVGMAQFLGVELSKSSRALESFGTIPGRMETIPNNKNLTVIVDYAPEPKPLEESLRAAQLVEHRELIHVFGATGGHRDVDKRFEFGKISARFADIIIITNDDVYDSDPEEIAKNIEAGIKEAGPTKKVKKIIVELDRKSAIRKALDVAQPRDLILITGKGSEQFLVLPGDQRIIWDDRLVVKELLNS